MLNSRPPRVLFIGEAVSLAHIGRPAVLARWTQAEGFETHFACGGAMLNVAIQEGLAPQELPTISSTIFNNRIRAGRFFYTHKEMITYITAEQELIQRIKPDVVVSDFRLTLGISTALAGVPLISTINAYWSPGYACPLPAPQAGLPGFMPRPIREFLFQFIRPVAFRHFAEPLNVIRKQFGLRRLHDFRDHYTAGTACAYLDLPDWVQGIQLPANHAWVGPVPWAPSFAPPLTLDHLESLRSNHPLAYVSLGSRKINALLKRTLNALLDANMNIVVSGVRSECTEELINQIPKLKARAIFEKLFDPASCLARAEVAVCHGGSGTIYQALKAGVPVLCISGNGDQELSARAASHWGACSWLSEERASPARIAQALAKLRKTTCLDSIQSASPTQCARNLSQRLNTHNTRRHWLNLLANVLASSTDQSKETRSSERKRTPVLANAPR